MTILLVGNPLANPQSIQNHRTTLSLEGKVTFEQLDRLLILQLPIYTKIYSGLVEPQLFSHTDIILSLFAKSLSTGGKLHLSEPVFDETFTMMELSKLVNSKSIADAVSSSAHSVASEKEKYAFLPKRTEKLLLSDLLTLGFLELESSRNPISTTILDTWITAWGLEDAIAKKVKDLLDGHLHLVTVNCKRPDYAVGAGGKVKFNFIKKHAPVPVATKVAVGKTWTISALDEDVELLDEDELLDEEEAGYAPNTGSAGDCSTKKKACKDCSCGRAEEEDEMISKITVVEKKTVASSCGSCYLGDAFRCGSCPFTGLPAFAPGDKVQLAGNLLKDDIE